MMSKAIIALTLLAAAPAGAQALKGHNANAPVDFEADRIEVQDRADRAILLGNVKVRQGNLTLDSARLTVAYTGAITSGSPTVQRLDASGGVVVRSPRETASGEFASYDLNRRLITVVGGVTLSQGANVLRGGRLVIDLNTGRSIVDGRSSEGAPGGTGGRVTGRFSVPQRKN
jgi:lipopolysaccharide export system protein LptA